MKSYGINGGGDVSLCGQRPSSMSSISQGRTPTVRHETPPAKSWNPASTPTMPLRHDFWRWNSTLTSATTSTASIQFFNRFTESPDQGANAFTPRCVLLDRTTALHLNKHQPGQAAQPASQPIAAQQLNDGIVLAPTSAPAATNPSEQVSVDQPSG